MWHLIGMTLLCYGIIAMICFPFVLLVRDPMGYPSTAAKDFRERIEYYDSIGARLQAAEVRWRLIIIILIAPLLALLYFFFLEIKTSKASSRSRS